MDLGLRGTNASVTGATRGIGRAIAEVLADEGCNVGICARDRASVEAAVAALEKKGVRATGQALDVRDGAALKAWVAAAGAELGGLDILVSNVSAMGGLAGDEGWKRYFEIDLMGTVHAVEAAGALQVDEAVPVLEGLVDDLNVAPAPRLALLGMAADGSPASRFSAGTPGRAGRAARRGWPRPARRSRRVGELYFD